MTNKFIFCLEAVDDVAEAETTVTENSLRKLATIHGIDSIYKSIDSIEGLEDSLSALLYEDHNFRNYEIIYLVMPGQRNNICLNDYYYSLEEIAELFEGRLKGKILHFSNAKVLEFEPEEVQFFLDVTGAKAISGYGNAADAMNSNLLDNAFFSLCREDDTLEDVVEELHRRHYALCKLLDFRLYY